MPLKAFTPGVRAVDSATLTVDAVPPIAVPVVKSAEPVIVASSPAKYTGRKLQTDDKDEKMSKADWAAKDRRISRAGIYQAALQSVGAVQFTQGNTLEDYLATVRKVAEAGLSFINEAKS